MKDFERSGVLRVKDIMTEIVWIPYRETKPEDEGLYLVVGDESIPDFKGAWYYHPIHGWSGMAHYMQNAISLWARFPTVFSPKPQHNQ